MQIENVHLLLVEDNPRFLSELLEWLQEYGYQQIETATSANAAFLNSKGGTLIIGVEDNGNIFGLEKDLSLLSNGNLDKLEQTIIDSIGNHIGKKFTQQVKIRFENIEGKDVCASLVILAWSVPIIQSLLLTLTISQGEFGRYLIF